MSTRELLYALAVVLAAGAVTILLRALYILHKKSCGKIV